MLPSKTLLNIENYINVFKYCFQSAKKPKQMCVCVCIYKTLKEQSNCIVFSKYTKVKQKKSHV